MRLAEFRELGVHASLRRVADFLEEVGLSDGEPVDDERRMSVPTAMARAFWGGRFDRFQPVWSNDFHVVWHHSDRFVRAQLGLMWELLELDFGEDIMDHFHGFSVDEVCSEFRRVARVVEFSCYNIN